MEEQKLLHRHQREHRGEVDLLFEPTVMLSLNLRSFIFTLLLNLGIREAVKDRSGASSREREQKAASGGASEVGQPSRSVVT